MVLIKFDKDTSKTVAKSHNPYIYLKHMVFWPSQAIHPKDQIIIYVIMHWQEVVTKGGKLFRNLGRITYVIVITNVIAIQMRRGSALLGHFLELFQTFTQGRLRDPQQSGCKRLIVISTHHCLGDKIFYRFLNGRELP